MRRIRLVCAAAAVAALGAAPFACSTPQTPLGAGTQCFQTTDCEQGLFCVAQPNGPSQCSKNLAPIVSTEDAPADAPAMEPSQDGGDASPGEGGGSDGPKAPQDGASDIGTPPDTGTPPQDAQTPPKEAAPEASPPPDVAQDTSSAGGDSGASDASSG